MEDLVDDLMEAKIMIRRTRMRLKVVVRTRGGTIQIIPMIKTIEIREEEEEGKEFIEEASMEITSIATKKGIKHLNVLSTKEGMIKDTKGMLELDLLMKIQNHHILKILKEEKSLLIE